MPASLPFGLKDAKAKTKLVAPQQADATVYAATIFVGISPEFAEGHIPGARWTPRGWLEVTISDVAPGKDAPILVTCANSIDSVLAAATLTEMGYSDVSVLEGGVKAWAGAGFDLEQGLSGVMTPPTDVVVMGPHRSYADTIHYLRWETDLGHKYTPKP